ncbi:MAG: holo-ACP synthase [Isosphaeraceae bacterium]|nr:holo-ACP synthase [Isosphaeraceae bacterium]
MGIIGHGIDVVEVARIKAKLESPAKKWAERVYSDDERSQADAAPGDTRYFAGRFAGKEAVAKALGTGFSGKVTWKGIEILRLQSGAPTVRLSAGALELAQTLGVTRWVISISYCAGLASASVIAVSD